ncbi:MAG: BrnT family toxin [Deltaproteobacteria bacterium]|nr:BrnT family toxin [Deltaproteobacteria bacterium]
MRASFDWDDEKDRENQSKHGVSFASAQCAFLDPRRVIAEDAPHSVEEERFYCMRRVGNGILTVSRPPQAAHLLCCLVAQNCAQHHFVARGNLLSNMLS